MILIAQKECFHEVKYAIVVAVYVLRYPFLRCLSMASIQHGRHRMKCNEEQDFRTNMPVVGSLGRVYFIFYLFNREHKHEKS